MNRMKESTIRMTTTLLASNDGKNTYAYNKEMIGVTGKRGIFILLYPTRDESNFHVEDMTNVHILNHMMEFGLSSYTVVNLFSQVTKSRLSTRGLIVDEENMKYIENEIFGKMVLEDTIVVVAWGNSHQTSRAVSQSKLRILEYWLEHYPNEKLYQLTAKGIEPNTYGIHPLFMGIRYGNAVWNLEPYPIKKILKNLQREEQEKIENEQAKQNKVEAVGKASDTGENGEEEETAEAESSPSAGVVVAKPVKGKQKREKKTAQ